MENNKVKKSSGSVFRDITPPQGNGGGSSSYLGGGYWKGIDYNQNMALQNVNSFQVGAGSTAIKMDENGLFLGGNKFKSAKIRITPQGSFIFNDGKTDRILIGED